MTRNIITKDASRAASRYHERRAMNWMARDKRRAERRAVRVSLDVATDVERWDERIHVKPLTGWDVW